jgi:hypothetical protein
MTMIDSNEAITVPSLWLKVDRNGLSANNMLRLARNDKLPRFRSSGQPDRFMGAMKQQSSSMMRLRQAESMILIRRTKGKEI